MSPAARSGVAYGRARPLSPSRARASLDRSAESGNVTNRGRFETESVRVIMGALEQTFVVPHPFWNLALPRSMTPVGSGSNKNK